MLKKAVFEQISISSSYSAPLSSGFFYIYICIYIYTHIIYMCVPVCVCVYIYVKSHHETKRQNIPLFFLCDFEGWFLPFYPSR